jgi:hypothetical protein
LVLHTSNPTKDPFALRLIAMTLLRAYKYYRYLMVLVSVLLVLR